MLDTVKTHVVNWDRLWRGPVARDSIIVTHESLQSTRVLKAAHVTSGAETQNSGAHRIKLKSPDWKSSCLKQKPTQSWKLPLSSCEPNDLVPLLTEQPEVLDGLWTLGIRSGDEQQGGDFKTPVFMANILVFLLDLKTTMAFEGLSLGLFKFAECKDDAWIGQQANSGLTKPVEPFHTENASVWNTGNKRVNSKAGMILGFQFEENTGTLGKPTTSLFQICGHMFKAQARQLGIFMPRALQGLPVVARAKRWHGALDGGFEVVVSQKEILEKFVNFMASALRKTKILDQQRHQNLLPDRRKSRVTTEDTCTVHTCTALHNMRKLPYDHLVLAILTCNYRIVYV